MESFGIAFVPLLFAIAYSCRWLYACAAAALLLANAFKGCLRVSPGGAIYEPDSSLPSVSGRATWVSEVNLVL